MGKTRSYSGNFEDMGRRSGFQRSLSKEQILELQDAITEFFHSEKERLQLERKIFADEDKITTDPEIDDEDQDTGGYDWEEEN
jgi:hypothetical protein